MLICTNDGFAGIDSIDLPNKVGRSRTAFSRDFDAGAPGTGASNPALAENGVIRAHKGVKERADLTWAAHGWDTHAPVLKVTVTRIG